MHNYLLAESPSTRTNPHFEVSLANDRLNNGIQHGTTTLAFKYSNGIIVAVDSRATAGSFIGISKTITRSFSNG